MHLLHEVKVLKILPGRCHECAEDRGTGQFTVQILKKLQSFWREEFQLYSCAKKFWHVNGLFYEELQDVMAFF